MADRRPRVLFEHTEDIRHPIGIRERSEVVWTLAGQALPSTKTRVSPAACKRRSLTHLSDFGIRRFFALGLADHFVTRKLVVQTDVVDPEEHVIHPKKEACEEKEGGRHDALRWPSDQWAWIQLGLSGTALPVLTVEADSQS